MGIVFLYVMEASYERILAMSLNVYSKQTANFNPNLNYWLSRLLKMDFNYLNFSFFLNAKSA